MTGQRAFVTISFSPGPWIKVFFKTQPIKHLLKIILEYKAVTKP